MAESESCEALRAQTEKKRREEQQNDELEEEEEEGDGDLETEEEKRKEESEVSEFRGAEPLSGAEVRETRSETLVGAGKFVFFSQAIKFFPRKMSSFFLFGIVETVDHLAGLPENPNLELRVRSELKVRVRIYLYLLSFFYFFITEFLSSTFESCTIPFHLYCF